MKSKFTSTLYNVRNRLKSFINPTDESCRVVGKLRIIEDLKLNPRELQMQISFGSFDTGKNGPKSDIKPTDESCKWVGKGGVWVLEVCLRQGVHLLPILYCSISTWKHGLYHFNL